MTTDAISSCKDYGAKIWSTYKELCEWKGYVCADIRYCAENRDTRWFSTDDTATDLMTMERKIEAAWSEFERNMTDNDCSLMRWLDSYLYGGGGVRDGQPGQIARLGDVSDEWETIGTTIRGMLESPPPDDAAWDGDSANSYRANIGPQASAIYAVADAAHELSIQYTALSACLSKLWSNAQSILSNLYEQLDNCLKDIKDSCLGEGNGSDHTWAGNGYSCDCWNIPETRLDDSCAELATDLGVLDSSPVAAGMAADGVWYGIGKNILDESKTATEAIDSIKQDLNNFIASGGLPQVWPRLGAA